MQLIERAKIHANRKAIISENREYTYLDLLNRSAQTAYTLLGNKTDLLEQPVAFLVNPSFNYTATQWGIWRAGGIAVPLCQSHPLTAIEHVLKDTGAKIIVTEDDYEEFLAPLLNALDITLLNIKNISSQVKEVLPSIKEGRKAMILYTSGTTSLPKGVVTTHANIEFQIKCLVEAWAWKKDDHILNVLPLHHVHGIINVMSCALWTGACCQFIKKFSEELIWEIFVNGKVNLFMAVPTIYYKLIAYWEACSINKQQELSMAVKKFRLMVSGSAALPISTLEKWKNISSHTLLERYGMTEIGMALSNPYYGERRPGHVGLPIKGVEIRLVGKNEDPNKVQHGEIQVKGPNVFLAYWNNPEATKKAFTKDGWFLTGDIATVNDGYYKILGRDSVDIIKSGGYKISSLEIEEILRQHNLIKECAVVGIPNEEWGELVVAFLVLAEKQIDMKQLNNWLKTKLPSYKTPKAFRVIKELPRNTLGKVTKNELKKFASQ